MQCNTRQSAAASSSASNIDLTYYNTVSSSKGGTRGDKKNKIQVRPPDGRMKVIGAYRVSQQVSDLGLVDLDLGYSNAVLGQ